MKAQSSVIMILFVIMIFAGLALFLLSLARTVGQEDYMNMYTHNLILSLLRADTGEKGECKYVSNTITCAAYGGVCDPPSSFDCDDFANQMVNEYMNIMSEMKPTYEWYIGVYDDRDFEIMSFGNPTLPNMKTKKWSASEVIYQSTGLSQNIYTINLILAKKSE